MPICTPMWSNAPRSETAPTTCASRRGSNGVSTTPPPAGSFLGAQNFPVIDWSNEEKSSARSTAAAASLSSSQSLSSSSSSGRGSSASRLAAGVWPRRGCFDTKEEATGSRAGRPLFFPLIATLSPASLLKSWFQTSSGAS